MASSGIFIKFRIFSLTDSYFAVGSSSRGSFNKNLGTGRELLAGRSSANIDNGIEVYASIDLGGTFGNFNVRLYAENELGIRSAYDEKVTQIMGNDLGDNTFSFAEVFCEDSEVISRSMSGTMFTAGNTVDINLNFAGNAPTISWSLFAPPGHPSEGEAISSNTPFDRLLRGFDLCIYRETATGVFTKVDSVAEQKIIQDAFPEWDYDNGKWWIGFVFEIDFSETIFRALSGSFNNRKIKLELTARTLTFAADTVEKTCTLNLILENEKTKLLSQFINTIKNDFHFSFEADDIDFKRVLLKQYIKNGLSSSWSLASKKEVANLSSAEKKSASIVVSQKWSNGRPNSEYRNQYQYVIEVYDAFGLSAVYCPKSTGLVEIAENYNVTDTTGKIFESTVRIDNIAITPVQNKFNVSWALTDLNGNSIVFKEDELDQIAVIQGIVGYFYDASGTHVVDAFKITNDSRFNSIVNKNDLRLIDLKQETFKTIIDNITFEENAVIQTGLNGGNDTEANRTLNFRLAILDAAGQVIDEDTVSGTNAKPVIKRDGAGGQEFSFDVFDTIGSVKFNLEFNEEISHIEIYRRPQLKPTSTKTYGQKSPSGTGEGDYSLTEDTVKAAQYNADPATIDFGEDAGTKDRSTGAGFDFKEAKYLVKTQTTEGANSLSINDDNQSTLFDENVPLLRTSDSSGKKVLENFTEYDYILVPYDDFGPGDNFIVNQVKVASYKLFSRNDRGFVGALDTSAPSAPASGGVKTSFKNWFLEWDTPADGEKSIEYKVTMVRDHRTAQDIDSGSNISFTKAATNKDYVKWSRDVTGTAVNDLHMATIFRADGTRAEISVVENTTDSIYLDRRITNITNTSGVLTLNGFNSSSPASPLSPTNYVTVEQFMCSTTSLQIEGETNQTGYFFIEAIDKAGNRSGFLELDAGYTLGQTKVTDIASFEQDITGKLPGAVALVPSDPFSVSGSDLSWSNHFIYKDGEAHYIPAGSISLTKELFVGTDIPSSVVSGHDEWANANANRFIKYIYWNKDGGYDSSDEEFKKAVDATDEAAWKKVNDVDQNITFQTQGYYSFSMFNPSSAAYNIADSGNPALYNGTGLTHEDYFGSNPVKKDLDLEIFNDNTWKSHKKYGAGTAVSTDPVNVGIRKHYGIHMPLEAAGEMNSHGQRTSLVGANSKDSSGNPQSGSIVIARVNKIGTSYSVSSAWHAFANAVIGSAMIDEASIKSAHVNDLTADTITGGTIQGHEIILGQKAEEANQHSNTITGNSPGTNENKFSRYGIIKSENYGGIYGGYPGFWINGDGTFSFSTTSGSSLSFQNDELVLRGRLVQPSGKAVASVDVRSDVDTVVFNEIQVEGHPESSLIESPSSEIVNIFVDIDNAVFSDGTPLTNANFRVKVYPEDKTDASAVTLANFKSSTTGTCYINSVEPDQNSISYNDINDINNGTTQFSLNFTDEANLDPTPEVQTNGIYNHKFLIKENGVIRIPEYFTVDVELYYDSGLINHVASREYHAGDVVLSGGNKYTAKINVPANTAISSSTHWNNDGAGTDRLVASQRKIIESFIEPASAIAYELKGSPSSQVMQNSPNGSGVLSEVNMFANYGTEARIRLDQTVSDVWALNGIDEIEIYREMILGVTPTSYDPAKAYVAGDVVVHNGNNYMCVQDNTGSAPPAVSNFEVTIIASTKWNPVSKILIGKANAAKNKIEYINFRLSKEGATTLAPANQLYRESFGYDQIAGLQIKFSAFYGTNEIAAETVDMVPSGVNSGVLTFHSTTARNDADLLNVIERSIGVSGTNRQIAAFGPNNKKTIYWNARYSSGNNTLSQVIQGTIELEAGSGETLTKSNITVSTDNSNNTGYESVVDVDNINDARRISLLIKSKKNGASAKEEISIVNEIDVPKNLNIVLPRQFIFFSREQGSVKNNILRLENIVPFQVLYGQDTAPINSDDVLVVVPSFGYIVNGKALIGLLKGDPYAGATMNFGTTSGDYTNIAADIQNTFGTYPASLTGDNAQEYQIFNESGDWSFKEKNENGTSTTIIINDSDDYYYFIPKSAAGDEAAKKAGKISLKATLNINDQGITANKITHKDVQQLNIIELAKDGENPLVSALTNSSVTGNADESKNIVNATRGAGLSEIEIFRGNKQVFLAPNRINFSKSGTSFPFVLDTTVNYIKYDGIMNASTAPDSFSLKDTEGNGITVSNSEISNYESISLNNMNAASLIVENTTTFLPSDDARKKKMVLLNSANQPVAHFTLNWSQEGYNVSLSEDDFIQPFSAVDSAADDIDCSVANLNFDKDVGTTEPATPLTPAATKPLVTLYTRNNSVEACIDLSGMNELNAIKDTNGKIHTSMSFGFPVKVYINKLSQLQTLVPRMNLGISQQGKAGPSFQFRGGYTPEARYFGDDVSQDMVSWEVTVAGQKDTKFYYVIRGATSQGGTNKGYDSTTQQTTDYIRGISPAALDGSQSAQQEQYWQEIDNVLQPTATSLLLADDILVKKGIVVGIDTAIESAGSGQSGFIASQLEPRFIPDNPRGNIVDTDDITDSSGNPVTSATRIEAQVFDGGDFMGLSDLSKSVASGKTYKTPRDFLPGFFLGSTTAQYLKSSGNTYETYLTSQLEMYSPFGNYLRWDGKNLIIRGGIIEASVKDDLFGVMSSSSTALTLKPTNPQVGNQTFIGGGFNNKILNEVDLSNLDSSGNMADAYYGTLASSIVGGGNNVISSYGTSYPARFSSICGGFGNAIGDSFSTIGGGYYNSIGVDRTESNSGLNTSGINAVLSGSNNSIENSSYSFVGSGFANTIDHSIYGSIINGFNNYIGGGTTQSSISPSNITYDTADVINEVYVKGFASVDGINTDVLNNAVVTNNQRYKIILQEKFADPGKINNEVGKTHPAYVAGWRTDTDFNLYKSISSYKLYLGFDKASQYANDAFNIFGELCFKVSQQQAASSPERTFDTGYLTENNNPVCIRVGDSTQQSTRTFKLGFIDGNQFKYCVVKTHTSLWPYVKIQGVGNIYKIQIDQTTKQIKLSNKSDGQSNFEAVTGINPVTLGAADTPVTNFTANSTLDTPTEKEISVAVPDPSSSSTGHFSFNSIFGGDYNQVVSSRRSTVVGGRNNKIKFIERGLISGVDNMIIGEQKTSSESLAQGFIVFGRDNQAVLSSLGESSTASSSGYTASWRAVNAATGVPTDYGQMSNVIFGGANLVRNASKLSILGSNNELLIKQADGNNSAASIAQVASEVTILGTDNKIRISNQVEVSNLGIFGTNFNLTETEMVQNSFYIGNPMVDDTVEISKLTRVFVAADGGAFFTGDVISFALSDKKYKTNILPISNSIDKLMKISGVSFEWKDNQSIYSGNDVGVIAQEIKEVLPEVVEEGRLGLKVKYEKITPLLIEAVKEQNSKIEYLEEKIKELSLAVDKLK